MEETLNKNSNESFFDYHKRLVYGKLVDKSLSDVDYTELAEYLYGKAYAPDVARRMVYGSKRTIDAVDKDRIMGIHDKDVLSDIDTKIVELKKERKKMSDQRREYMKLISSEARFENIMDKLNVSANNLGETIGNFYEDTHINNDTEEGCEAVLVLSDWHYGLKTQNVFNKYDIETCKSRIKCVVDKAIRKLKLHQCSKLHIVVLGDLIHGAIHTSARVASEELVCDQLMQATELLAQTIEVLSNYVRETVVYVTYGNHGRTVQNKSDNIHRDNMERLAPWWLEQRLSRYDNIHIQEDSGCEFLFINACGHQMCASHGDNDSVKSSPRLLSTLFNKKLGKDIEYILVGDKHHNESYEELGVTAILCGALCGTDDYANEKRLYSVPSQLLLIVNEDDGVDAEYKLRCDK